MRLAQVVSTSALSLLLVSTALVYGQNQREDPKPEEPRPEATKPAQQDEMKAPPQDQMKTKGQEEAKPDKQQEEEKRGEDKATKEDRKQDENNTKHEDMKSGHQENRAAQSDQHAQHASDRRSAHIPDDKFRAHFGREHKFAIQRTIVQGQPGFQYGGYSFIIVDAWPVGWAYTDDCYVDYVDGEYFLFDLLHPGVRIALVAVF